MALPGNSGTLYAKGDDPITLEHKVTLTDIYEELGQLRKDFHALDKKVVEQNHIKNTLGQVKDCLELLTAKVEQHDRDLTKYKGRARGKQSVSQMLVQWIPVVIMTVMLIVNILYNGGG